MGAGLHLRSGLMKAQLRAKGGRAPTAGGAAQRVFALVVAANEPGLAIAAHLRRLHMEVHLTRRFGDMAAALFDERDSNDAEILFVLDLRISCGAREISARLGDYDAVLHAQLMSGNDWPRTVCLVDPEQTRPAWLQARPHVRATLLADEVETVIGHPKERGWHDSFALALDCCLRR